MPTYTVHEPPRRNGSAPDPQRFAFVRDGFHFWAFLLSPLWLLYRRLWLVFVCYLLIGAATEIVFWLLRLPSGTRRSVPDRVGHARDRPLRRRRPRRQHGGRAVSSREELGAGRRVRAGVGG